MAEQQKIAARAGSSFYQSSIPSVVKEIFYGISVALTAGLLWKMHHWNLQRRTKEFYDILDKGLISVVVEDE